MCTTYLRVCALLVRRQLRRRCHCRDPNHCRSPNRSPNRCQCTLARPWCVGARYRVREWRPKGILLLTELPGSRHSIGSQAGTHSAASLARVTCTVKLTRWCHTRQGRVRLHCPDTATLAGTFGAVLAQWCGGGTACGSRDARFGAQSAPQKRVRARLLARNQWNHYARCWRSALALCRLIRGAATTSSY